MLLVLDECQTGLGRLGAMYGFEPARRIVPDLLVLSKTLGGGVPISALATSAEIEQDCHARGFVHVTSRLGPDAGRRGAGGDRRRRAGGAGGASALARRLPAGRTE